MNTDKHRKKYYRIKFSLLGEQRLMQTEISNVLSFKYIRVHLCLPAVIFFC